MTGAKSNVPATIDVIGAVDLRRGEALTEHLIERFQAWRLGASKESIRAVHGDLKRFGAWAAVNREPAVPASIKTISDYIGHLRYEGKSNATITRALSSISLAHRLAGVPNPTKDEAITWRLKGLKKDRPGAQKQAAPLRYDSGPISLVNILDLPNRRLSDLRDKAMISLAYDTGLRRAELVAVQCHHLQAVEDGHELIIPAIKGGSDGYRAYVTPETVKLIETWMGAASLAQELRDESGALLENPLFLSVDQKDRLGLKALTPGTVSRIFKDLAKRAGEAKGLSAEEIEAFVKGLSGHSTRVGSTQDLFAGDVDIGAICNARRWKSPTMPLRYTEALATQDNPASEILRKQRRGEE